MRGIRFYRASVKTSVHDDILMFRHDQIDQARSDFDYIFRPIYAKLSGSVLLNDQLPLYDDENRVVADYVQYLIQDRGHCCVVRAEMLIDCGPLIPEFEGNELVFFQSVPSAISQREYSCASPFRWDDVTCVISNWDGIYWQLFSADGDYFEHLLMAHGADPNLDMRWVDADLDYPEPARGRENLALATKESRGG